VEDEAEAERGRVGLVARERVPRDEVGMAIAVEVGGPVDEIEAAVDEQCSGHSEIHHMPARSARSAVEDRQWIEGSALRMLENQSEIVQAVAVEVTDSCEIIHTKVRPRQLVDNPPSFQAASIDEVRCLGAGVLPHERDEHMAGN
jgi:hypothetical protein